MLDRPARRPATADIPIVVASVVDDRARGLALGAQEYLLKPVRAATTCSAPSRGSAYPAPRGRAARRRGAMSRARILVVEDNPLNLKLVRDVLGAAGYDVVSATSGEEGLAVAAELPPGPGAHGPAAARDRRVRDHAAAARRDAIDSRVPVVAVTASAMTEDQERVRRAGFDAYLEKPISVRGARRPGRRAACRTEAAVTADPVTVLAVDDQPANLPPARRRARPRAATASLPASSGQEALDAAARTPTSTWCCSTS